MDKKIEKDPYTKLDELWRSVMVAAASEDITKLMRCAFAIKAIQKQVENNQLPIIEA